MARLLTSICLLLICFTGNVWSQTEIDGIASLMQKSEFASALARLESLPKLNEPKLCYWKAICESSLGQTERAMNSLEETSQRWPDSEYSADAKVILTSITEYESTAKKIVSTLRRTIDTFKASHDVVELRMQFNPTDRPAALLAGIDFTNKQCQVQVRNADHSTKFQIQSTAEKTCIYLQGRDEIVTFETSMFPVLNFTVTQNEDRTFQFSVNGAIGSDPKDSEDTLEKLLSSKWAATDEGLHNISNVRAIQKAYFPVSVEVKDGVTVCKWLRPLFSEPGFSESKVEFSFNGSVSYHGPGETSWSVNLLKHDDGSQSKLAELEWPELKPSTLPSKPELILEMFQSIQAAFNPPPAPSVADQKESLIR